MTVERRFAVLAGSCCGRAWGGDWDLDLLRAAGAREDFGGRWVVLVVVFSRYAGLVRSVGEAGVVGVFVDGVCVAAAGMMLLLLPLRMTFSDFEDLCFLDEESDGLTVGAGAAAPSSLPPRLGRELSSKLGWVGRPPTVLGLP